jgi:hypothetical protein
LDENGNQKPCIKMPDKAEVQHGFARLGRERLLNKCIKNNEKLKSLASGIFVGKVKNKFHLPIVQAHYLIQWGC